MSDSTPETTPKISRNSKSEVEDSAATPLVEPGTSSLGTTDQDAAPAPVLVEPVSATEAEPVAATTDPAAVETVTPEPVVAEPVAAPVAEAPTQTGPHVLYVEAPHPPRVRGNRGVGTILALVSAVVFAVLYAVIIFIGEILSSGSGNFTFVSNAGFWAPPILFAIGFIILVLIVNRAGWAAHVIGSLILGVFVYFATAGALLLINLGSVALPEAGAFYREALINSVTIIAALLAREVALWVGFGIAARGRRVKARNLEAREAYDREFAEKRAAYERENLARRDAAAEPAVAP